MDAILTAACITGGIGLVGACFQLSLEIRRRKKREAEKEAAAMSFASRHENAEAQARAKRDAHQVYLLDINAAFAWAREDGKLIVSEVSYGDIERDSFRKKERNTLLTRFKPIMTIELAKMIREYEIDWAYDPGLAYIGPVMMAARAINWRVEEVPVKYEPKDLKDVDRIRYPDMSSHYTLPTILQDAARQKLSYGDEYIQREAAKRVAEVEENEG